MPAPPRSASQLPTELVNAPNDRSLIIFGIDNLSPGVQVSQLLRLSNLQRIINNEIVAPEMWGAAGDGIIDDSVALQSTINSGKTIHLRSDAVYFIGSQLNLATGTSIIGNGATIRKAVALPILLSGANKNSITLSDIKFDVLPVHTGTAQGGGANSITLAASASGINNFYNGTRLRTTGGPAGNQIVTIINYNGATKLATVSPAWTTQPNGSTPYEIWETITTIVDFNVVDKAAIDTCRFTNVAVGIKTTGLTNSQVRNNTFRDFASNQILCRWGCSNNVITGNTIDGTGLQLVGNHCIDIEAHSGEPVSVNNTISGNAVTSFGTPCQLTGRGQSGNLVAGNVFKNISGDTVNGVAFKSDGGLANVVRNNVLIAPGTCVVDASGDSYSGNSITGRSGISVVAPAAGRVTIHQGTAQSGGANTIQLDTGASSSNDAYKDMLVWITAGAGAGAVGKVLSYVGATRTCTMTANWTTPPNNTSDFEVILSPDPCVIKGNIIKATAGAAFGISVNLPKQIISENEVFDFFDGINAENPFSHDCTVQNNSINRSTRYGYRLGSNGHHLSNNTVRDNIGATYAALHEGNNISVMDTELINNAAQLLRFNGASQTGVFVRSRNAAWISNLDPGNTTWIP